MTQIIGITGIKGSGKTTLASMLAELIPDAEIVSFADALRDEVRSIVCSETGIKDKEWLESRKGTVYGPLLQGWGELMRQHEGEDYWIKILDDTLLWQYSDTPAVIIPDVCYPNEADFVHRKGGLLVAIHGPSRWEGDTRDASHPSETSVVECQEMADIHVWNDRGLEELRGMARMIANKVMAHVGN